MSHKQASLREHIRELRTRLVVICVVFFAWCSAAWFVREPVTHFVLQPLGKDVYYTTPQGGFEFFVRVVMTMGFIAAVPVIVHQLLRFIEPALGGKLTGKMIRRTLLWSLLLAAIGVAFAFLMVLPTTLEFFGQFGGKELQPLIAANDYLNMVLGLLATFALVFQLPLIISIIDRIKPLKPQQLTRYRRHTIIASLIAALILPFTYDPATMFIIAAPIIILFELSVLGIRYQHRATRAQKRDARIAELVEAMRQANTPTQEITHEPVVEVVAQKLEPIPDPDSTPIKVQKPRVLVGPSRLATKSHPQILDLRSLS